MRQSGSTLLVECNKQFRIVREIESVLGERMNHARDLRDHHPESTEERLITHRRDMWEILRVFDVRGPTIPKLPQAKLPQGEPGARRGQ